MHVVQRKSFCALCHPPTLSVETARPIFRLRPLLRSQVSTEQLVLNPQGFRAPHGKGAKVKVQIAGSVSLERKKEFDENERK